MKALVTGGSGFIGSFIVEELAKQPNTQVIVFDVAKPEYPLLQNVTYVDGDTRYQEQLDAAVRGEGVEEIYDVAGVLGTSELMFSNQRAVDVNIRGALNVLEVAHRYGVPRVFHPTKPNDWLNTYSITKFAAEQFCLMFAAQFGMHVAVLKWFNAYGPRQHLYPVRKAVPLFIVQALNGEDLEVFGDGEQTVDMIYVRDIAKIAIRATRAPRVSKVIDVGSGIPITVNQLAAKIIEMTGSVRSKVKHLPMRAGEPERSDIRADVTALKDVISLDGLTDFEAGLADTIAWYRKLPLTEQQKALRYFSNEQRSFPV